MVEKNLQNEMSLTLWGKISAQRATQEFCQFLAKIINPMFEPKFYFKIKSGPDYFAKQVTKNRKRKNRKYDDFIY